MTQPTAKDTPELISLGASTLVSNAARLGISWKLRLGTVTESNSVNRLTVRMDSDTDTISAVSMVGSVPVGFRVYVITTPPSGNFVVGVVSRLYPDQRIATAVRTTNSAGFTTTETVTDTVVADLISQLVYRVRCFTLYTSTVANDSDIVRIREDSLTGTVLQASRVFIPIVTSFCVILEAEYTAVATGSKTFVVTGSRGSGTGTITHGANATAPVYLYVDYIRSS